MSRAPQALHPYLRGQAVEGQLFYFRCLLFGLCQKEGHTGRLRRTIIHAE